MKDRTPLRILVAIDFSPASRRALRYATDLAAQTGAQLDAVHVMTPHIPLAAGPEPVVATPVLVDQRREIEAELKAMCAPARDEGVHCETHMREGDPAREILDCAEKLYADHIVLGAHGHSALQDFLLGSVARDVQKRAKVPVTTLRDIGKDGD